MQVQCSSFLKFFLCTVYAPVCTVLDEPIPPCRSLCVEVRSGCEQLMNRFGFQWPDSLDCFKFPADSPTSLCVGENRTGVDHRQRDDHDDSNQKYKQRVSVATKPEVSKQSKLTQVNCPPRLRVPEGLGYRIELSDQTVSDCGLPCSTDGSSTTHGGTGNRRQESVAGIGRTVILVAAVVCVLSTLFTMMTFAVDRTRFRYPERSLVFLAVCYFFISNMYLVGSILGREVVSCAGPFNVTGHQVADSASASRGIAVVNQGTKHELCAVIFAVVYFFSTAASIWWVILALTWFLAAGLKWGREAIESHSAYYHLAAWAMPAVQTFAALGTGSVGGDPLPSICSAGGASPMAGRVFVVIPQCVYLAIGTALFVAGFVALFRIRKVVKRDVASVSGTLRPGLGHIRHGHSGGHMVGVFEQTQKLERLIIRLGVFGILYTVPATVVVACVLYDQSSHDTRARHQLLAFTGSVVDQESATGFDGSVVFVVKYVMTLVIGITSVFWVWSAKTAASWRRFCGRLRPESPSSSGMNGSKPMRV